MDVDNEIDQNLLQQFSCMGTTDREVLISQLQKLVGNQLNNAGASFFLDMNNWNLQAAVCSYFDYESPRDKLPTMAFVLDVTIGDGESVPPNTNFIKTWRVQNSGDDPWPPGCSLRFTHGERLGPHDRVPVDVLLPKEMTDVSVEMVSPEKPGIYQGQWRMSTANGFYFGDVIWVIVTVAEGGILGLTQQMSKFSELGSPPKATFQQQQQQHHHHQLQQQQHQQPPPDVVSVSMGNVIAMPNGISTTNSTSTVTMASVKSLINEVWTVASPDGSTMSAVVQTSRGPSAANEDEDMMA